MKKIIVKSLMALLAILVLALLTFCSVYLIKNCPRSAEHYEVAAADSKTRVLIATQGSEFKNEMVRQLTRRLALQQCFCQVTEIKDLKNISPDDWDRIILINSFVVKLNRHVSNFIKKVDHHNKVLLHVSAGGADWQPEPDLRVDALTSSSRLIYHEPIINLMCDWVSHPSTDVWIPDDYVVALQFFAQVDVGAACQSILNHQNDYLAIYNDLESRVNQLGYYFIRLNNLPAANQLFKLNTSLFPEKANVWDSYAESFYLLGNRQTAKQFYQKALELDSELESAKRMLAKILAQNT